MRDTQQLNVLLQSAWEVPHVAFGCRCVCRGVPSPRAFVCDRPLPYPSETMATTGQRGSGLRVLQDPQTTPALQRLLDTCSLNDKIVTSEIKSHYLASELGRMIPLLSLRLRSTEPSPWLLFALLQPGPGGFGRVPEVLPVPNGCSLISTSTREVFIAIKTALKVPSCWARHEHSRR